MKPFKFFCAIYFAQLFLFNVAWANQDCNGVTRLSAPDARFDVQGAEVLDLKTGLTWQRCPVGQSLEAGSCTVVAGNQTQVTWAEALALSDGDWRIPNIKELLSIVEFACSPTINTNVFPVGGLSIWSSTPWFNYWSENNDVLSEALVVSLRDGWVDGKLKSSDKANVLLVRDGS